MMRQGSEAPSDITPEAGNAGSIMPPASPKVSVVIPTCHRNDVLAQCLDCLAPGVQTLPANQYEVIVTDDGRKTTAQEMILQRYPWVRWVEGPRRGPAANRNNGARNAQGTWIVFTDDDCVPSPGFLEAYQKAVVRDASVYEGKTTCKEGLPSGLYESPVNLTGGYLWSCNMMVARALFSELNGFDERFPAACMEDVEFRERLKDLGYRFPFVEDAVVNHPPRRRSSGYKVGLRQESHIVYYFVRGQSYSFARYFRRCVRDCGKRVLRDLPAPHCLLILTDSIVELATAFWYAPSWKKKHAHLR